MQTKMNLSLGKPMYTEIFTVPKSQNNNLTNSVVYSFSCIGNSKWYENISYWKWSYGAKRRWY
jgi:hypothetical protein